MSAGFLSMGFPLANSSISLSRYRISRIKGSSIFSIRTPQTVTFILVFIHLRSALKKTPRSERFDLIGDPVPVGCIR